MRRNNGLTEKRIVLGSAFYDENRILRLSDQRFAKYFGEEPLPPTLEGLLSKIKVVNKGEKTKFLNSYQNEVITDFFLEDGRYLTFTHMENNGEFAGKNAVITSLEQARLMTDLLPAMVAIGDETDLIYGNTAFLDFFCCDSIEEFRSSHGSWHTVFTPRKGYLHAENGEWLNKAKKIKKNEMNNKVLLYSQQKKEYRTFVFEFQPIIQLGDSYAFIFADITDMDNYNFILQDVQEILEHEVEKKTNESGNALLLMKQQRELLVQQSKLAAMGNMINMITHQWKQPLNAIGLLAQNLEEDYKEKELNEKTVREYTNEITKQVRFMSDTMDDFRSFFRPSKAPVQFSVAESVSNVCNLLKHALAVNNITVKQSVNTPEGKTPVASGYPNELKQVLMNLIVNSKDAITSKAVETSAETAEAGLIEVETGVRGEEIYIRISDNGGGIPENIIKRLFEPYVTTKGEKGTGIGLYMSRFIMEKMYGSITAENAGSGAVFTVTLPKA